MHEKRWAVARGWFFDGSVTCQGLGLDWLAYGRVAEWESLGARGPGNQRKHLEYIAGSG